MLLWGLWIELSCEVNVRGIEPPLSEWVYSIGESSVLSCVEENVMGMDPPLRVVWPGGALE